MCKLDELKSPGISYPSQKCSWYNTMHKIIVFLVIFLLVLATPVYATNSFQYSRTIQTDNSLGYKSIILDQDVYAHSNRLNDLRVLNDKDEEIPYYLVSIRDASTDKEKESFILAEETQFTTTQNGTDSIINVPVNNPNVFYLKISTTDRFEKTYGLFGITSTSKRYLADGSFTSPTSDLSFPIQQEITWTDTNPVDHLEVIIHNREAAPITIKSINVKYYLTKLVFKGLGDTHYRLSYGNELLRSPIYNLKNYKEIEKETITHSLLSTEVYTPLLTNLPKIPLYQTLFFKMTLAACIVLLIIGLWLRWKKTN